VFFSFGEGELGGRGLAVGEQFLGVGKLVVRPQPVIAALRARICRLVRFHLICALELFQFSIFP
jgi:hypothetical protein